jgi:hypothetical protein
MRSIVKKKYQMYSTAQEDAGFTYSVFFKRGDDVLFEIPLSYDQAENDDSALAWMDSWINNNSHPYISVEEFELYKTVQWELETKEMLLTAVGGDVDLDGMPVDPGTPE